MSFFFRHALNEDSEGNVFFIYMYITNCLALHLILQYKRVFLPHPFAFHCWRWQFACVGGLKGGHCCWWCWSQRKVIECLFGAHCWNFLDTVARSKQGYFEWGSTSSAPPWTRAIASLFYCSHILLDWNKSFIPSWYVKTVKKCTVNSLMLICTS